jgi:hypothetical protein
MRYTAALRNTLLLGRHALIQRKMSFFDHLQGLLLNQQSTFQYLVPPLLGHSGCPPDLLHLRDRKPDAL